MRDPFPAPGPSAPSDEPARTEARRGDLLRADPGAKARTPLEDDDVVTVVDRCRQARCPPFSTNHDAGGLPRRMHRPSPFALDRVSLLPGSRNPNRDHRVRLDSSGTSRGFQSTKSRRRRAAVPVPPVARPEPPVARTARRTAGPSTGRSEPPAARTAAACTVGAAGLRIEPVSAPLPRIPPAELEEPDVVADPAPASSPPKAAPRRVAPMAAPASPGRGPGGARCANPDADLARRAGCQEVLDEADRLAAFRARAAWLEEEARAAADRTDRRAACSCRPSSTP